MHQRRGAGSRTNSGSNSDGTSMYGRSSSYGGGGGSYNPETLEAGGGRGRAGMSASEMNASIMEQQNNERISQLGERVEYLKGLTMDINTEVKEQNSLLDNMGDGFSNTKDMLAGSLKRIGTMLEKGGAKHMCYMVGFVVAVMVLLYWLMSSKA